MALLYLLLLTLIMSELSLQEDCAAMNETGGGHFDISLPDNVVIPELHTFYVCQQFQIPDILLNETYHITAFTPIINNTEVMHHMILFGCNTGTPASEPHNCGNQESTCRSFLTVWSLGFDNHICLYPKTGISIGKNGYHTLSLQIHWNNEKIRAGLRDSSGIRIYFTKVKRKYELGNVQIGQNDIEIPEGSIGLEQSGSCSPYCTRQSFSRPFYLTRTFIHMHSLGVSGRMDQFRNGTFLRNIAYDQTYSYTKPPVHVHPRAIKIMPGDEIKLTCWFTTVGGDRQRNRTIYWGEGVEGEMCYAFVSYFPKALGFDQCVKYATYDQCDNYNDQTMIMGKCDFRKFAYDVGNEIGMVRTACPNEDTTPKCNSKCAKSVKRIYSHPCMQGRLAVFLQRRIATTVNWHRLKSLHQRSTNCGT